MAARKDRYILERHVQPRVGWMLRQPDSDPPLAAFPHNAPLYRIDWMCDGAGLLCAQCAAEHYRAEGPHTDWRHRSCIVCGDTVGLVSLTATVRVIQQVRISGGRSVAGLLETTPIVWECIAPDGFLDTKVGLRLHQNDCG